MNVYQFSVALGSELYLRLAKAVDWLSAAMPATEKAEISMLLIQ